TVFRVDPPAASDHLVRTRRDLAVTQRVLDLAYERRRFSRERLLDEPPKLHAREVRGRGLVGLDLRLEAADLFVLVLDLYEHGLAILVDLEDDFELVLTLVLHVILRL